MTIPAVRDKLWRKRGAGMKVKKLARCALFAAAIAVCAWLSVPLFGVPVTMQSFAVALSLLILGGKWGSLTVLVYLCLGAVGLPVFSGFGAGIGALFGPTGGFLWGFLAGSLGFWAVSAILKRKNWIALAAFQIICYACGGIWFAYYSAGGLWQAVGVSVFPFLFPDFGKLALAWILSRRLRGVISE